MFYIVILLNLENLEFNISSSYINLLKAETMYFALLDKRTRYLNLSKFSLKIGNFKQFFLIFASKGGGPFGHSPPLATPLGTDAIGNYIKIVGETEFHMKRHDEDRGLGSVASIRGMRASGRIPLTKMK